MVNKQCSCCNKPILVRLSDIKRGWGNFCDRNCSANFRARMYRFKKYKANRWIIKIKKITGVKNNGKNKIMGFIK